MRNGRKTGASKQNQPDKALRGFEAFGERKSLREWSQDPRCTMSYSALKQRVYPGTPLEAALVFSVKEAHFNYWAFGEVKRLAAWLRDPRCRTPGALLKRRLRSGERFESAITRPESEPMLDHPFRYGGYRSDVTEAMAELEYLWRIAKLTIFGETKTAGQWTKDPRCEISRSTIIDRIRQGWPEDERILRRTTKEVFPDPFVARTDEGIEIGDFPNIHAAELAILAQGNSGTVYDRIKRRVIPIPRVKESRNPSRSELYLTAWGETKTVAEWSRDPRCVVRQVTLYSRLRTKIKIWSHEAALSTPADERFVSEAHIVQAKLYEAFGESKTIEDWAKDPRCTVRQTTLASQISKGVPLEVALGVPPKLREAFGERKTIAEWAKDPRCEVTYANLRARVHRGTPLELALQRKLS